LQFRAAAILTIVLLLPYSLFADEVPLTDIRRAINEGVRIILDTQRDDGAFVLSESHMEAYPIGNSALALMSLQYARAHLGGKLRADTLNAIRKGMGWMSQQPPDEKTYSSGLAICAFFMENPTRYKRQIAMHAMMLITTQHEEDYEAGEWGYRLRPFSKNLKSMVRQHGAIEAWADRSNTQFALLGLYHASRAGFQVPKITWQRSADHYKRSQFEDGGWGYMPTLRPDAYANMTIASTISLNLCEEMLRPQRRKDCSPPPRCEPIEKGLDWIDKNWRKERIGRDPYGLYALERLGIIMGRANIGSHDWYNEGAAQLVGRSGWGGTMGGENVATAFGLMFLARGLEPIIFNKLERRGTNDWNNDPYDIKHLTEYIRDHYQKPVQWRIVSLDAPLDLLLRTPMLYISGCLPLEFNEQEKQKLKDYVAGGGTIIGQACCGKKAFDKSFRELIKELFETDLAPVPNTHPIYRRMKSHGRIPKPRVEMAHLEQGQGRPFVIYLPQDHSCRWHTGGPKARDAYAVGKGIYFYVTIEVRKMIQAAEDNSPGGP